MQQRSPLRRAGYAAFALVIAFAGLTACSSPATRPPEAIGIVHGFIVGDCGSVGSYPHQWTVRLTVSQHGAVEATEMLDMTTSFVNGVDDKEGSPSQHD
jgi:hypothetical protein